MLGHTYLSVLLSKFLILGLKFGAHVINYLRDPRVSTNAHTAKGADL